jgi:multiple sugar transport system substrate-binding protein
VALVLVAGLLAGTAVLLDAAATPRGGKTVVTMRLWDEQVASAYRQSFAAFTRAHPDIEVRTNVVAYSTYFDTLRTDVAGGSADDIFWVSNAYLAAYADSGRLMRIEEPTPDWEPSVVAQFTRDDVLWGVPQLTDAGVAVYYNADLLDAAGVDPAVLAALRWGPDGGDTLRPLLARLTVDTDGHTASTPGFDARRVRQWGYNAANDPQGIYLNYIGSAGGVFYSGDRFAFDNRGARVAFRYLIGLINDDHVAPPAADTNDNSDFSRNQFLAGKMALFQSGTYNLAAVAEQASFRWGVAMLPVGPQGRVSVTNGIAAAGNAASEHPDAVRRVLAWMGSRPGNEYLGRRGSAIPAVRSAQRVYFDYWAGNGVDVTPFFSVLNGPRIPAPGGAGFGAGYQALKPYFDEMFLGHGDVADILRRAQEASNTAAER